MPLPLKIDFVSDVSCPWCIIGLKGLDEALSRVGDLVEANIRFQPFELNPDMARDGQKLSEHVAQKYGSSPQQFQERREMIRERAAALGFAINLSPEEGRVYNTFDAHRLLHWAAIEGRQRELKLALFDAYFTRSLDPSDHRVLADAAERAGLDRAAAESLLESGLYGEEVRAAERTWQDLGISGVPTIIFNDRYAISGGQPADVFERAIRQIAAEAAVAT